MYFDIRFKFCDCSVVIRIPLHCINKYSNFFAIHLYFKQSRAADMWRYITT